MKLVLKIFVSILLVLTLIVVYSYFHVKSSWKSFITEKIVEEFSEEVKEAEPLPNYFYELYSADNNISLNNNYNKYLFENLSKINDITSDDYSTPPSLSVAKYIGPIVRENRDYKKQRRDRLFYITSLTWKLEELTTQSECLNWLAKNYEFVYDNKGVEKASQFFYKKPLVELDTLEMSSMVIMMRNPSLYNPERRYELVKKESLKLIEKLEHIKE